ncbi:hypothetical protein LNQ81_08745 [Myroides sp. M-43]|uniref:hypothetical protein n=1 Tax=Myroides oncorhynchi TaxID=2893756 RepID=UPI001E57ACC8|nr:hypothetical protein [Myroides oncorhynchi]MCC9042770.1 hypothetical protein [Myroides oncorhynchi]
MENVIYQKEASEILFNNLIDINIRIHKLLEVIHNSDDWKWLQDLCLKLSENSHLDLSNLAITCIGHIGRMHKKLKLELVVPFLQELKHNDGHLSGNAESALDDIYIFMYKGNKNQKTFPKTY